MSLRPHSPISKDHGYAARPVVVVSYDLDSLTGVADPHNLMLGENRLHQPDVHLVFCAI